MMSMTNENPSTYADIVREIAPVTSDSPRRSLRVSIPARTRPNFSRSFSMKNVRKGIVAAYSRVPRVDPSRATNARVVSSWDSLSLTSRTPRASSGRIAHALAHLVDETHRPASRSRIRVW